MTMIQQFSFVLLLLFPIKSIDCLEAKPDEELIQDGFGGLTDRELILKLVKRIDDLEKWNQKLEKRNEDAEISNRNQQRQINTLQSTVRQQKRRLQSLEWVMKPNYDGPEVVEQTLVKDVVKDVEDHAVLTNKQRAKPFKRGIVQNDDGSTMESLEEMSRLRRQTEEGERVAFFAKTEGHLQALGAGQVLEFANVTTNVGNGYSATTGIFTAPYGGVYVFSTSLMGVDAGKNTHYIIAKNHAEVSRIYIRGQESPYTTSSHTVVLQLQQGDDVEIRNVDAGQGVHGAHYSCFSGFLLYGRDSSNIVIG